ncbi:MAG TPA: DUF1080 domain-containing protein [Anaerohalosphaeraceae bacterium]|nr:DUF1080 domain-containing protein [Anaerohalosphaeraceae bacterium]
MKRLLFIVGSVLYPLMLNGCAQQIPLFNGYNLDGWKPVLSDTSYSPPQVWSVRNGILRCEGKPNGYLRTTRPYSHYKLRLEWRWPQEPANSGILVHAIGPDQVWPTSIEAQLRSGDAGDIILIGEDLSLIVDSQKMQPTGSRLLRIERKNPTNEKKPGQWNRCEIICRDSAVEIYINGLLQNKGSRASVSSGYICLQSEGAPIEFRNIILEPLPQTGKRSR